MSFMPFKWCPHCGHHIVAGGFCADCRAHLKADTQTKNGPVDLTYLPALYRYHGVLRSVILRAKVNNENTAYHALCDLVSCHPTVIEMALAAEVIVPAPSSLWGRIRGKYDLAQGMALAIGHAFDRPVELLPRKFYFHYRKRAGRNLNQRDHNFTTEPSLKSWQDKKVLLIDDIITTGFTLSRLSTMLSIHGAKVQTLALASAKE